MKTKLLSLLIVVLTILLLFPLCASAANDHVYDYFDAFLSYTTMTPEFRPSENYVRFVIQPKAEQYGINDVMITFSNETLDIFSYPYVRLDYRTDTTTTTINTTISTSAGENWLPGSQQPKTTGGGKWSSAIVDLRKATANTAVTNPTKALGAKVRFKVCGNQPTITKETYFDAKALSFFKTEAEAKAFNPDNYYKTHDIGITFNPDLIADGQEKLVELDAECDALIEKIKNTPTTVTVTGQKYYVSAIGDDNADGKTPQTAWKTLEKASSYKYKSGDGVFFRRGDYFRANQKPFLLQDGVTYSAYGKGEKPVFVGSLDGASPAYWHETDVENVYRFSKKDTDIGCIVFDGGRAWGIKVSDTNFDGISDNSGYVNNGLESFNSGNTTYTGYESLKNNLEFTTIDQNIYLYCKDGNPGEVFTSIELSPNYHGVSGDGIQNVVFDNIKLYGYGAHGISVANVKNFTVQNCVFGWIGGSQDRYGNAVQNWGNADNFVIDHCYSYQVYDCCYTTQYNQNGGTDILNKDVIFKNTVSEYSNSGPEIWNHVQNKSSDTTVKWENIQVYGNFARRMGYGWSHQRPNKNGNFFYGAYESYPMEYENFKLYDNKFMTCSHTGLVSQNIGENSMHFNGNTYVIGEGKLFAKTAIDPVNGLRGTASPFPYNADSMSIMQSFGVETDGEFYSIPADYTPPAFDYAAQNDIYQTLPYRDLSNHWAFNEIRFVYDKGLFEGISEIEFSPNNSMTRAMLFTVLARLDGKILDTDGTNWYDSAVDYAVDNGFTSEENARPNDPMTRSEFSLILSRFIKKECAVTHSVDLGFKDVGKIVDIPDADEGEMLEAVKTLVAEGIISGFENNTFRPNNSSTRAQVAAMIYRTVVFLNNCEYDLDAALETGVVRHLSAAQLAKMLKVSTDNATIASYTDSGVSCVRITPTNTSTSTTVTVVLSQSSTATDPKGLIDFFENKYMIVKYKIKTAETSLDVGLISSVVTTWTDGRVRTRHNGENWNVSMNYYYDQKLNDYGKTHPNKSDAAYAYTIKPWGNNKVIAEGSYMEISDIYFTSNKELALIITDSL